MIPSDWFSPGPILMVRMPLTEPVLTLFTIPAQHCPERANDTGLQPFTKARLATLWAFLGSLFVREYIALSLQRRTITLKHADLLKSRIRNPWSSHRYPISRMNIPFASTLLLFTEKKTSRHMDLIWHQKNPVMSFASNPLCRLSIPLNRLFFSREHIALHCIRKENKQTLGSMASKESSNVLRIKSSLQIEHSFDRLFFRENI
jgi:hypothetical protein